MEEPTATHDDGLMARVRRLFHPGPLAWILGLEQQKVRFHAGEHLHGLDERDEQPRTVRGVR